MLAGFASGLERQLSVSTKGLLKAQAKVQKALRTGNEAEMKIAQAEASRLSSVVSDIMKRSRESAKEIESYNKALEKSNDIFTQDLRDRREKVEELGKAGYIAQEVMLGSIKSSVDALHEGVSSLEGLTEGSQARLPSSSTRGRRLSMKRREQRQIMEKLRALCRWRSLWEVSQRLSL